MARLPVQDTAQANQLRLRADLDRQAAATAQAREEASAAAADASAAGSAAEERRCQLAAVMDTLAALQVLCSVETCSCHRIDWCS